MKNWNLILLTATCAIALTSCKPKQPASTTALPSHTPPPTVLASPEGAVYGGEFLFVSNVGKKLEPSTKDADGFILKYHNGKVIDREKWSQIKLDAPKGMAILGSILYVTDIDRLVAIDLETVAIAWTLDFSAHETTFLNDIAKKDESSIFISATDINTIFEVNVLDKQIKRLKIKGLNGPNGLLYMSEGNKLICAEYGSEYGKGKLVRIDMGNNQRSLVGELQGSLDGVVELRSGDLLVTDWDVKGIHRVNMRDYSTTRFPTDSLLGPADLAYNPATQQLAIPRMMENKLTILDAVQ